ncbi:hypothetical protein SAMD00019534_125640 [Acytostelium subglobosum LB1]|uniref:hypothetical protein n=1 Tax=Acytostelium subglobosum LB1 TaxID=1410327 RepID=UPI0006448086|nr:hypothetical protein SAMD00019534_125640 [Acytostelium subglobosum LB1]GAM29388.1 hypothetical protein SAMD00019534_125640 [Acytostelium subglobosum LB1]|eukprot:XP_012747656.1 hypothetical protein SAMD00019534_125640 [Acytostelium subglobosum LB1]
MSFKHRVHSVDEFIKPAQDLIEKIREQRNHLNETVITATEETSDKRWLGDTGVASQIDKLTKTIKVPVLDDAQRNQELKTFLQTTALSMVTTLRQKKKEVDNKLVTAANILIDNTSLAPLLPESTIREYNDALATEHVAIAESIKMLDKVIEQDANNNDNKILNKLTGLGLNYRIVDYDRGIIELIDIRNIRQPMAGAVYSSTVQQIMTVIDDKITIEYNNYQSKMKEVEDIVRKRLAVEIRQEIAEAKQKEDKRVEENENKLRLQDEEADAIRLKEENEREQQRQRDIAPIVVDEAVKEQPPQPQQQQPVDDEIMQQVHQELPQPQPQQQVEDEVMQRVLQEEQPNPVVSFQHHPDVPLLTTANKPTRARADTVPKKNVIPSKGAKKKKKSILTTPTTTDDNIKPQQVQGLPTTSIMKGDAQQPHFTKAVIKDVEEVDKKKRKRSDKDIDGVKFITDTIAKEEKYRSKPGVRRVKTTH